MIVDRTPNNFGCHAPDLPGCVATGDSVEDVLALMKEAIETHLAGLEEDRLAREAADSAYAEKVMRLMQRASIAAGGLFSLEGAQMRELVTFFQENRTAPDEAGVIHMRMKFKTDLANVEDKAMFALGLNVFRIMAVGALEIDARENKPADPEPVPPAPLAPHERAFEPGPQPFAATGFSADA